MNSTGATCPSDLCSPQIHQCNSTCTTYAECANSCYAPPTANYTLMVNGVPTQGKVSAERLTINDSLASCTDYEWYVIAEDIDSQVKTDPRTFKVYNLPTLTLQPAEFQMEEHLGTADIDFNWTANSCSGTSLTCTVNIDGTPFTKTCTSGQQCSQNYTFNASAVCSHPWSVTCTDPVGQTTSATGTFYITINTCTNIVTPIKNPVCKITSDLSSSGDCMRINSYTNTSQGMLILDCQGYKLTGTGSGSGVLISGSNNVRVTNCDISGFEKGISVVSSISSGISGSNLHDNAESGADLSGSTSYVGSTNVSNNGLYGIYIHGSGSGSVSSSSIYNHDIGIEVVDSAKVSVSSSNIYNNKIGIDLLTSGTGSSVSASSVHDNSELGVLVQNNHGATIGACSPGSCYRNTAYNNPYGSIVVKNSDNVGVSVYGYKHNKCENMGDLDSPPDEEDDFYCYPVVHINSSSLCTVSGGYFSSNNRSVYIEGSSKVTVSGNTFSSDSISVDAENAANLSVSGNTFSGCERALLATDGSNFLKIAHNKITCNSALYLFEVSDAVIYDNKLASTSNLEIIDSTGVVAHVYMPGTENILECDNTGGNAWLDSSGKGFSNSCVDLNGDCFCDNVYDTGEGVIDEYPLALSQAYEIGLTIESVGGSMPGTYEQYTSKEYVAATKSSSPEVVFMLVAAYSGKSTCTTNFGNSFIVKNNELSNFTLGGLSQGCYVLLLECAPEVAPELVYSSEAYFCVDYTPPFPISFPLRSEMNGKVVNPDSGEILNESRFFLNASISETTTFAVSCRLEWKDKEVNFTPSFDGTNQYCQKYMKNGTDNLTIENTTYTYRICATDAAGNEGCSAFKTVTIDAPPLSGGCEACENVGNFSTSAILVVEDKASRQFKITLYSESLTTFNRTAVQYAPVIVYVQNSTYSYLSKAITNDGGTAYFDYSKWEDVAMQYSFSYCCFYEDCGFEMCMNASGISQGYRDENGISDIFSIPDASPAQPALNPVQQYLLPSSEKTTHVPEKCATNDPLCAMLQMQQAMCIPVALLFALLLGSLYYTGKNPFAMLDVSPLRLGKHIRYSPRGIGKAQITAQTLQGYLSRATAAGTKGAREKRAAAGDAAAAKVKAEGGDKAAQAAASQAAFKGAKPGLFSSIGTGFKSQLKSEAMPFVNLARLVKPGAGEGTFGKGPTSFWQRVSVALIGQEIGGKAKKEEAAIKPADTAGAKAGLPVAAAAGGGWLSALGFAAAGSGTGVRLTAGVTVVSQAVSSYNYAMGAFEKRREERGDEVAAKIKMEAKLLAKLDEQVPDLIQKPTLTGVPQEKVKKEEAVGLYRIPQPKKPTLTGITGLGKVVEATKLKVKELGLTSEQVAAALAVAAEKDESKKSSQLSQLSPAQQKWLGATAELAGLLKEEDNRLKPYKEEVLGDAINNLQTKVGDLQKENAKLKRDMAQKGPLEKEKEAAAKKIEKNQDEIEKLDNERIAMETRRDVMPKEAVYEKAEFDYKNAKPENKEVLEKKLETAKEDWEKANAVADEKQAVADRAQGAEAVRFMGRFVLSFTGISGMESSVTSLYTGMSDEIKALNHARKMRDEALETLSKKRDERVIAATEPFLNMSEIPKPKTPDLSGVSDVYVG